MMTPPPVSEPEAEARVEIDAALVAAGWAVQNRADMNPSASRGVAVREFRLKPGHGFADYLLLVDGKAVGVLDAKPAGHTLTGVEPQSEKYAKGLPDGLYPPIAPLPFLYLSTGAVTKCTNLLDPHPRSRPVFQIHSRIRGYQAFDAALPLAGDARDRTRPALSKPDGCHYRSGAVAA